MTKHNPIEETKVTVGFWDRLGTDEDGMPVHLPMGVNASGQGPENDSTAHHFVCWCGDSQCPLTRALALSARAEVESWERVWRLLGEPGVIEESKAEATWVAVRNLLDWIACGGPVEAAALSAEIDRMVGELSSIRMEHEAEVAALRDRIAEVEPLIHKEKTW